LRGSCPSIKTRGYGPLKGESEASYPRVFIEGQLPLKKQGAYGLSVRTRGHLVRIFIMILEDIDPGEVKGIDYIFVSNI